MNRSISETESLRSKQADGVIPIEPQVFNGDLPADQQCNYLSQAEERQADEHIAAWEQYNMPWTLGFYLDSLRRSPQILLEFDDPFPSSSLNPDRYHGQPPDRDGRLFVAETGQMPAINKNQKKVPKYSLAGPGKCQAGKRRPAQIDEVAAYTLPTGEVISGQQKARRGHFVGFPPITQPLPEDIEDEDIIKHWPNHLWGPLLLRIAEKWKQQEIAHMTPVDLKANAISKRLAAARIQGGEEPPTTRWRKRKSFAEEGKPLDEHQVVPQAETVSEDSKAFRLNNARAVELEDVRQSDRRQKRRKSNG